MVVVAAAAVVVVALPTAPGGDIVTEAESTDLDSRRSLGQGLDWIKGIACRFLGRIDTSRMGRT